MNEALQEYSNSRGVSLRVDREAGILRGVKILGLESRNNRSYLPEALARAAALYEGAKVNVNHPKGNPLGPRDYQDRLGTIQNVSPRAGEGLFADLHFNPRHALAEQLMWDAEHAPENVGLSHNVEARTSRRGERVVVEEITQVQSVDLVADPATTRGLFESGSAADLPALPARPTLPTPPAPPARPAWDELTADDLRQHRPDLVEALTLPGRTESTRLREEITRLRAREAEGEKRQTIRSLLRQLALPDPDSNDPRDKMIVSAAFLETLRGAADERAMRVLVEERARLVEALRREWPPADGARPASRDQHLVYRGQPLDAKVFVAAIT